MCLIGVAWQCHPQYLLIIAANRDELHARPSLTAHWWANSHRVFGGLDLVEGGTWCAVSRTGRVGLVANLPGRSQTTEPTRSRGQLVKDWITGEAPLSATHEHLIHTHEHFGGFSLLLGTMNELWILRSPTKDGLEQQRLKPGIHTITNTDPSTQWPKAAYLERALESLLPTTMLQPMDLLHILAARRPVPPTDPADEWLPAVASTPFIANSTYGTRASTVLLIQRDGHATFVERSFDDQGRPRGDIRETFAIKCD